MSAKISQASLWLRLLKSSLKPRPPISRETATFPYFLCTPTPTSFSTSSVHFCTVSCPEAREIYATLEREKQRLRDERKRKGLGTQDIEDMENEDYMGVTPLIEKLQRQNLKLKDDDVPFRFGDDEPTDSDSDEDDDEREHAQNKRDEDFQRKLERYHQLIQNFVEAETSHDAYKWMSKIDKFEEKHFQLRPEYKVIGELINRLKIAEGKDKFILQQRLNRALRLIEWKEANDPSNPDNCGLIEPLDKAGVSIEEEAESKEREEMLDADEDDEEEFDEMKEKDDVLLERINAIDRKLEEKLAQLDHTFGKKGKALEEEIRDLAEERNDLMGKKKKHFYRKGFDVRVINVNRTCKMTKGGRVVKYSATLACGNYHGVVGFAKARASAVPIALHTAYQKCFQNLHYFELHEEHTIAHAVQAKYKRTKVYLWPAPTRSGMSAGFTVKTILHLAGFKNVKSKVVGSRNNLNTVRAVFQALNAIDTPKDVQEKFGRTVVEKYLL